MRHFLTSLTRPQFVYFYPELALVRGSGCGNDDDPLARSPYLTKTQNALPAKGVISGTAAWRIRASSYPRDAYFRVRPNPYPSYTEPDLLCKEIVPVVGGPTECRGNPHTLTPARGGQVAGRKTSTVSREQSSLREW